MSLELACHEHNDQRYAEGPAGQPLLRAAADVISLLEACWACGSSLALLYAENLPPGFVDLSTGVAGEVLLKLQLYHVRLVVVLPLDEVPHSDNFAAMVREANRGRDFFVAATRAEAEAWLLS